MKKQTIAILIRQACFLPLYYLVPLLVAGSLVTDYNQVGQHASEINIAEYGNTKNWISIMCFAVGTSYVLFSIGLLKNGWRNFGLIGVLFILFGISMYNNSIYPIGSPMHGYYGIGILSIVTPFLILAQNGNNDFTNETITLIKTVGMLMIFYLWILFSELDPGNLNALTKRLGAPLFYGWTACLAFILTQIS